ncbi:MAG: hypothetical protein JXD19_11640 [Deltaproteobacteria bacterium]|nr:hypothetical protein [Deltaproteobacteria bacterium]
MHVDKMINLTIKHAKEIATEVCSSLRENIRTPWYHSQSQQWCILRCTDLYENIGKLYHSSKPYYQEVDEYFTKFAKMKYQEGTPLHELIYAIVMMRRQMWLFTEGKALVETGIDLHNRVETIGKMIHIFDRAIYCVIKNYGELQNKQQ